MCDIFEVRNCIHDRALGVDRMEDQPVVEMVGDMEVVDAEFKCRD